MPVTNINHKIPGEIPPPSNKEKQGYIEDLGKKELFELKELLERQNKLLFNKRFISKLPDKGEKIRKFREKILLEMEHKNEIEQAAKMLSELNIANKGKAAMTQLEWTGIYSSNSENNKVIELDSDDETDPLKILAQPTGSGVYKKKIVYLPPEETLIKKEDIEEIESSQDKSVNNNNIDHIKFIIDKVEHKANKVKKEPFKPHKTTISNVHDPEKEKLRKKHKYWENTAATPPLIVHGAVKTLSINESLELEKEKTKKLKELQIEQAAERLKERLGLHSIGSLPAHVGNYRDHKEETESSSDSDHEENQVYDDEDEDRGGTVSYVVDSIES